MGGDASSGNAVTNRRSERLHGPEKYPQIDDGSSFTGVGGDAKGGEFQGKPGMINLFSGKSQCYTALLAHTTTRSQCRRRRNSEQWLQWCLGRIAGVGRALMGVSIL